MRLATRAPTADEVRRGIHLLSPVLLAYYVLPTDLGGVDKRGLVAAAVVVLGLFEGLRLWRHWDVPGLRDYERHRLAGYAWGGFGMALGFLFFPPVLHVVTFCGMAWVDPLCRWSKARGLWPRVPGLVYFGGAVLVLLLLSPYSLQLAARPYLALPLALVGSAVALAVEYPKWMWTDDDFLMNVAPLAVLSALLAV